MTKHFAYSISFKSDGKMVSHFFLNHVFCLHNAGEIIYFIVYERNVNKILIDILDFIIVC